MKDWVILNQKNKYFDVGVIPYNNHLKINQSRVNKADNWAKSVLVFVFPYNQKKPITNDLLSAKFAYGKDYHQVLLDKINDILNQELETKSFSYEIKIDQNFLDEKKCASLANLGMVGKNNLLLSPRFGSFVYLATVILDYEFSSYDNPFTKDLCGNCDLCIRVCPTKALSNKYQRNNCLSYITQYVSNDYYLYDKLKDTFVGCDICQAICPYNKIEVDILDDLKFNNLSIIKYEEFVLLDSEKFKSLYQDKAFSWVGYLKLLRNVLTIKTNLKKITLDELDYFQNKYNSVIWFYEHINYLKEKLNGNN